MTKLAGVIVGLDTESDTAGLDSTDTASALAGCGGVELASALRPDVVDLRSAVL